MRDEYHFCNFLGEVQCRIHYSVCMGGGTYNLAKISKEKYETKKIAPWLGEVGVASQSAMKCVIDLARSSIYFVTVVERFPFSLGS